MTCVIQIAIKHSCIIVVMCTGICVYMCMCVLCVSYCRAKEIKHSGPNIGKKVVKKPSVASHSVKSSTSPSPTVLPVRPRGRPPKNGYPHKPSVDVDTAKRKSDGPNSDRSSSMSAPDKFPFR